jgi:hypothetical protein
MGETTCTRCGATIRPELSFCVRCGEPVGGATQTPAAQAASPSGAPTTPEAIAAPTPPVVRTTEALPAEQKDQTRRVVLAGVLALVLTLIARVAYSAATYEPEPDGEILAQLPAGPEGASEEFDDGGKIEIPKGALKERQTVTVRRTVMQDRVRAISPYGGSIVIPAGAQTIYIFSPATIVFSSPVTITLPLPPPPAQGIVFVSANGQITFIQGNAGDRTITIRVTSFNFADPEVFV